MTTNIPEEHRCKNPQQPWPGGSVDWSITPIYQKVMGLITSQGAYGRQPVDVLSHVAVSLSLSFSFSPLPPSSLSKINKHMLR